MIVSITPEEKTAAVERSRKGYSKWHCFACGRNLAQPVTSDAYPTIQTNQVGNSGLTTVYFCTTTCKAEWSKRQDAAEPVENGACLICDREILASSTYCGDCKPANADIRPDYYHTESVYEPFKIIRHYGLNFFEGSILKYLVRAGKKPDVARLEDLIKLRTYINSEIEELEKAGDK